MNDFRSQIPQSAFINAQVIHDAMVDYDLERSLTQWSEHYKIPKWNLINPAHVASLLYCLIVVPKELWDPPSNDDVFVQIGKYRPLDLFTVRRWTQPANENCIRDFLRHLRNAISHVRFTVDGKHNFEFWDERQRVENYRVSITRDKLARFLSIVGHQLANLRSR